MKVNAIDIDEVISKAKECLEKETQLSGSFKAVIQLLILLIGILAGRLKLNSSNSSKPPSMDPNRKRKSENSGKKPGGQKGHKGSRLEKVANSDIIKILEVDKNTLPPGKYQEKGFECRQVVNIEIKKVVTEYRAQILEDAKGKKYIAPFPQGVNSDIQYGNSIKAHSVYLSQFQLLPYNRIAEYFEGQEIFLSPGSIFNFNQEASELLKNFDEIAKKHLINSAVLHSDETGVNINGKREWLHLASNPLWTYYYPHGKRGSEAMDAIGILPNFSGVLCHDHWKPYYKYKCFHALCNAHHLRELERVIEIDKHKWAQQMQDLLVQANEEVTKSGGSLSFERSEEYRKKYRQILKDGDIESPLPLRVDQKRGKIKKTFSRNLLERLREYEGDTLRFMENPLVPFTNNLGENDLRMTKVQQKISGCFRSIEGAYFFCLTRSYLSTCRKHGMSADEGLKILFDGKLPSFCQ